MKSELDIYLTLVESMYADIADSYSVKRCVRSKEIHHLRERVRHEGVSFLTKTLPSWGKALDKALSSNSPFSILGLRKSKDSSLPLFMGWLLEEIFGSDGVILPKPNANAVRSYRQFTYMLYKLELPMADGATDRFLETFERCDLELPPISHDMIQHGEPHVRRILLTARMLCTRLLADFDWRDVQPNHGPGSVSTGESVIEKSHFSHNYASLAREYPFDEYFSTWTSVDNYRALESETTPTAKVVLVPKDSRGPRVISCEPLELQWIQQGIRKKLYALIERHPMTRGLVNFTDQSINRNLALESSRSGRYVTLDMKDASDRVSTSLVEALYSGTDAFRFLSATRSTHTRLPNGKVIALRKFAPMGSALCFPIEALSFYMLSLAVIHHTYAIPLSTIVDRKMVYVYGDDLIVDAKVYASLLRHLPEVGLKFNESKCCTGSHFRESCGCDAFQGVDVTPIKIRKRYIAKKAQTILSWVEYSNALYKSGYIYSSEAIEKWLLSDVAIPYSRTHVPGYVSFIRDYKSTRIGDVRFKFRYNRNLCRTEILGLSVCCKTAKYTGSQSELFSRHFISNTALPPGLRYSLRRRIYFKRRWAAF